MYTREQWLGDMQEMLDFLCVHPEVPAPIYSFSSGFASLPDDEQERDAVLRGLKSFRKVFVGDDFHAEKCFGLSGNVKLVLYTNRDKVCKRVVIGKKMVDEVTVPAQEGRIIPAHEEDIVKWVCDPILGMNGTEAEE